MMVDSVKKIIEINFGMEKEMNVCSIDGCERKIYARSLCLMHYIRLIRHGDPLYAKVHGTRKCEVPGCGKKHDTAGYCHSHYNRFKRHGNPEGGRKTYKGEPEKWILDNLHFDKDECLIWPYAKHDFGYGMIHIDGRSERVHVVIATIVHGHKPTTSHEVLHTCGAGNIGCVNPIHMRWGTRKENCADALLHGTRNRGERNGQSKLQEDDVIHIRQMLSDGVPQSKIAKHFGVIQQTISYIKKGKTWGWLSR